MAAEQIGSTFGAAPLAAGAARRYAVAVAAFLGALGIAVWLQRTVGHGGFAAFSAGVVVAAWYGGLGPGLLVSAASVLSSAVVYIAPISDRSTVVYDLVPLALLATVSLLVSLSSESLRRSRRETAARLAELAESYRLLRDERAAAEQARGHLERLFDVTAALSTALTPDAVAAVVLDRGMRALGASAGSIALVDEGARTLEIVGTVGYPEETVERWRRTSLDDPFPLADAARSRAAILLAGTEERDARYPHLAELRRSNGSGAMAAVPLLAGDAVVGVIGLNFPESRPLDDADRRFLLTLARQCAYALERARLFHAEHVSRAEAEEANRAKSEFLAMMSHELRTPLNAIAGYVELMEMGIRGPVTEMQREDLARIRRSQRHLLGIINDILNFAKIEAGRVDYDVQPIDAEAFLAGLEALVAPQLAARSIRYRYEAGPAGTRLLADRDRLQQVLLNLLSNAIKFTPAGGLVAVGYDADASAVRIHVRDTGPGIAPSRQARIFEPFVQLDTALTGAREGTGLGLAISRDLARGMGGELTVESEPGAGSTFTCTLRRADG